MKPRNSSSSQIGATTRQHADREHADRAGVAADLLDELLLLAARVEDREADVARSRRTATAATTTIAERAPPRARRDAGRTGAGDAATRLAQRGTRPRRRSRGPGSRSRRRSRPGDRVPLRDPRRPDREHGDGAADAPTIRPITSAAGPNQSGQRCSAPLVHAGVELVERRRSRHAGAGSRCRRGARAAQPDRVDAGGAAPPTSSSSESPTCIACAGVGARERQRGGEQLARGLAEPTSRRGDDAVEQRAQPGAVEHVVQRHVPVGGDDEAQAALRASARASRATSGKGAKRRLSSSVGSSSRGAERLRAPPSSRAMISAHSSRSSSRLAASAARTQLAR